MCTMTSGATLSLGPRTARCIFAPLVLNVALLASVSPAAHAQTSARLQRVVALASQPSLGAGAWSLPEPSVLIERVLARIVTQDKPGGVPMLSYPQRFIGRSETVESVRRFLGRTIDLAPTAFSAVSSWTDSRMVAFPSCMGFECPPPENAVWVAVTRIDRGELPHEVNVWYTTNFAAYTEAGVQKNAYAFCERWLRVGGVWRYDGFIRVNGVGTPG